MLNDIAILHFALAASAARCCLDEFSVARLMWLCWSHCLHPCSTCDCTGTTDSSSPLPQASSYISTPCLTTNYTLSTGCASASLRMQLSKITSHQHQHRLTDQYQTCSLNLYPYMVLPAPVLASHCHSTAILSGGSAAIQKTYMAASTAAHFSNHNHRLQSMCKTACNGNGTIVINSV